MIARARWGAAVVSRAMLALLMVQLGIGLVPDLSHHDRPVWSVCGQALCNCKPEIDPGPACPLCEAASPDASRRVTPVFKRADRVGSTVQFLIASCVILLGTSHDACVIVPPAPSGFADAEAFAEPDAWRATPEPPPPKGLA